MKFRLQKEESIGLAQYKKVRIFSLCLHLKLQIHHSKVGVLHSTYKVSFTKPAISSVLHPFLANKVASSAPFFLALNRGKCAVHVLLPKSSDYSSSSFWIIIYDLGHKKGEAVPAYIISISCYRLISFDWSSILGVRFQLSSAFEPIYTFQLLFQTADAGRGTTSDKLALRNGWCCTLPLSVVKISGVVDLQSHNKFALCCLLQRLC